MTKPAKNISPTVILPLPNTIALGGVAIGNINAQLLTKVAGIVRYNG
jgi:hypothetical protein